MSERNESLEMTQVPGKQERTWQFQMARFFSYFPAAGKSSPEWKCCKAIPRWVVVKMKRLDNFKINTELFIQMKQIYDDIAFISE